LQYVDIYLWISLILFLTIFIFTLLFICSGIKVLKEWERVVILRLGKFIGVRGPGIIWKTPILDKVVLKVSLRVQSTEVDTGKYISSDNSARRLKGIVQWRIIDVEKYALRIDNHDSTVTMTIQHNVKKVAESLTSDAVFSEPEELNSLVEKELEPVFSEWGLEIIKVDLRTAPEWE
jgi:regulator of protease activity HflC (stomatin/prohibitin superfamily)